MRDAGMVHLSACACNANTRSCNVLVYGRVDISKIIKEKLHD